MTNQFVGRWTGHYFTVEKGAALYVIERMPDGTYQLQTVRVDPGKGPQRESESGKWFIQDRSYKLKVEKLHDRAASPWNTSSYQTYAVGEVQPDSIKLTHSMTGQQVLEKRVAADYQLR